MSGSVDVLAVLDEWIAKAARDPEGVRMDRELREVRAAVAKLIAPLVIIDRVFLPRNPNKMRSAAPEVVQAVNDFRAALARIGGAK